LLITIQTIGRGAAGPEKGGDVRANQGSRRSKAAGGDAGGTNRNGRNGPGSSMLNSRDDDSSFGSSESELDVGEIMGMSGRKYMLMFLPPFKGCAKKLIRY